MGVKVTRTYDDAAAFAEADSLEVQEGHLLVQKSGGIAGNRTVAVFAPSSWISAQIDPEGNSSD